MCFFWHNFLALMQQFIVSVPTKMALAVVVNFTDDVEIKLVADAVEHREDRGYGDLAAGVVEELIL
ncbi:MAG TPA: hypothetical protein GX517_10870 [Alicyclobacillus sp.]|nr:hypothetical protein [Alicyclobacillus sp.]